MKKINFLLAAALVAGFAFSCKPDSEGDGSEPVQLSTPVLEITGQDETSFTISWESVENASSYVYTLNGGNEEGTAELSVSFTELEAGDYTVKVKAIASNPEEFADSEWAEVTVSLEGVSDEPDDPARWITFDVYLDTDVSAGLYPYNSIFVHLKTRKAQAIWLGAMSPELSDQECVDELQVNREPLGSLDVELCNQGGLTFRLEDLEASTEYTVALIVQTADDDFIFLRKEITTGSLDDADPRDKWVGTWTLTSSQTLTLALSEGSWSGVLTEEAVERQVTISKSNSYPDRLTITGFTLLGSTGVFGDPVDIPASGRVNAEGDIEILPAEVASTGTGDILTWFAFLADQTVSDIIPTDDLEYIFKFNYLGTQAVSEQVTVDVEGSTYISIAVDVIGVNPNTGAKTWYYSEPVDLPAGTLTITKND